MRRPVGAWMRRAVHWLGGPSWFANWVGQRKGAYAVQFHEEAFARLQTATAGEWRGAEVGTWLTSVGYELNEATKAIQIHDHLSRADLFELSREESIPTRDVCVLVFAWGEMRPRNAKLLLKFSEWVTVADRLRRGQIDHYQAYASFHLLSQARKMLGCGPAYYTKLLMFLPAEAGRGFILDQWTARSVSLLVRDPFIKLLREWKNKQRYRVHGANGVEVYRRYCGVLSALADSLAVSPHVVETLLFSEGRGKGDWREYLKASEAAPR